MANEGDMSLFNAVLEPFRRVINTDPPKDKLSASSKLNFSDSNQSLKEGLNNILSGSKRKSSIGGDVTPDKRMRLDSDSSNKSAAPLPSPWEAKKLKIDLIGAKAQITKLEARVNHQHTIRKEMQILFEEERASLVEQHKRDERALKDMEDRLAVIRRRELELKEEYNEATKTLKESKTAWDKDKAELQKQIADLKDKLLEANVSSKDQLSEMKKDMDELLQALEGAQSEVDILKQEVSKQTGKADQYVSLRNQLEKQTFELQQVTNKLKEMEYERDSYKDWQTQAKTAQKRLTNMAELEKEVCRLRATERSLRDGISSKLLLEEQVHLLTSRVEALQPVQQELHEAKVKMASLESSLQEWQQAARSHGVENARALSNALDSALNSQLSATADNSQAQSQLSEITEELATLKYERDRATRKLTDTLTVRKNQDSLIHRLQKRLLLVTRERDSYRQQLDCYEKELTVTGLSGEAAAGSALLSARVEQLEKSLQQYRDLLAAQDTQADTKVLENLRAEVNKWRDEAENARRDVMKLRAQRDTLQSHIEKIGSSSQNKVLHLVDNPSAAAQKQMHADLEAAQEELYRRLCMKKRHISPYKSAATTKNADLGIKRLNTLLREGGSSGSSEETAQLKQQLDNSVKKLKRMKEEFTSSAQEFREACYTLLGYKIDRTGYKIYKLTNMYTESNEDYLTFTWNNEGVEMVHTDYSTTLGELVELHLHQNRSIPLFLSALTMELFSKQTIEQDDDDDDDDEDD